MGNSVSSNSKGHHEDTVDFGSLTPQGVYNGPRDWNHAIVTQLICERKLAPFYRPLEDYEDNWDDEQILAARRELPEAEAVPTDHESTHSSTGSKHSHSSKRAPVAVKEDVRCPEAAIYRGAVECPICFLYYPPNINHSRCCDQAICTECFVQIKRADPTTTHIVSEPAACPYCVQDEFGVHYTPPPWRAGIGSDGSLSPQWLDSPRGSQQNNVVRPAHKRRQKSFGADSPDVVTTDRVRPDWEQKLAAVRAAVARRANRRIIMRQVGDRLIPVGVTSGRVHALTAEEASQAQAEVEQGLGQGGSRRSRRNRQNPDLTQLLGQMGLGGQDVEELMMMEAMRLSLLEHEEHQRREAAKGEQNGEAASSTVEQAASAGSAPPTGSHTPSAARADGSASPSTPATAPAAAPPAPPPTANVSPATGTAAASSQAPTPPNSETALSELQRRQLNPPPFSTIAAAMSAANAATAILSNRDSTRTSSPTNPPPASTVTAGPVDIPGAPTTARPNLPPPSMSFASSMFSTESNEQTAGSTYEVLDSDMDSEMAREPLLGSGPPTPTEAAPEAASSFEESLT